jgi:hypothetical protein
MILQSVVLFLRVWLSYEYNVVPRRMVWCLGTWCHGWWGGTCKDDVVPKRGVRFYKGCNPQERVASVRKTERRRLEGRGKNAEGRLRRQNQGSKIQVEKLGRAH